MYILVKVFSGYLLCFKFKLFFILDFFPCDDKNKNLLFWIMTKSIVMAFVSNYIF